MAAITIRLKSTRRWWVIPLVTCAAYVFAISGCPRFPDRFVEWVAVHSFRIEVDDE